MVTLCFELIATGALYFTCSWVAPESMLVDYTGDFSLFT